MKKIMKHWLKRYAFGIMLKLYNIKTDINAASLTDLSIVLLQSLLPTLPTQ